MNSQSPMLWEVSARTLPTVVVTAPNWMAAIGMAMDIHGLSDGMERVACERLRNGTIIINDLSSGRRITIRPRPAATSDAPPERPLMDWMLDCVMEQAA